MLPTLTRFGDRTIFESPYYVDIPHTIEAISTTDERNILDQLLQELNAKFNTELLVECSVNKDLDQMHDMENAGALYGKRVVMVCASHTARLANVFEDMGAIVVDLSIPGWRINTEAVSSMLLSLSSVLAGFLSTV
jgi:hypothetical protein